jgi:hypothetical protein
MPFDVHISLVGGHLQSLDTVSRAHRTRHADYSINLIKLPLSRGGSSASETLLLIAHMRYTGGDAEDLKRDMAKIAEDPETQRWWKVSYPT